MTLDEHDVDELLVRAHCKAILGECEVRVCRVVDVGDTHVWASVPEGDSLSILPFDWSEFGVLDRQNLREEALFYWLSANGARSHMRDFLT